MMYFPRWVSWLFVLFLGYILVVGNFRGAAEKTPPAPMPAAPREGPVEKREYPALQALTDGDRWRRVLNPLPPEDGAPRPCAALPSSPDAPGNYAIILRDGEGVAAGCGDAPVLRFTLWTPQGAVRKVMDDKPYRLGEMPGLDALLVGMRMGERRLLLVTLPQHIPALPLVMPKQMSVIGVERTATAVMKPASPADGPPPPEIPASPAD